MFTFVQGTVFIVVGISCIVHAQTHSMELIEIYDFHGDFKINVMLFSSVSPLNIFLYLQLARQATKFPLRIQPMRN